jgi:uncharacterized tellurite resistance protein B-like protein
MLTLAKVIVAAAWADGEITHDEVNSVKDLLFHLPRTVGDGQPIEITSTDWATLKLYAEAPVSQAERTRLVEELRQALQTPQDRQLAITALENLVQADGLVTDQERAVVDEITAALDRVDQERFMSKLSRLLRGPVQRRSQTVANAPNREMYLEDYLKNKVYLKVKYRLHLEGDDLDIPDDQLRKLSLAGGLMARIAHVDNQVVEAEFDQMVQVLQTDWNTSLQAATLVAQVAVAETTPTMDYYRMTREFFEQTTEAERVNFLDVLLDVAAADGGISHQEQEEFRLIARGLMVNEKQYTEALKKAHQKLRQVQ